MYEATCRKCHFLKNKSIADVEDQKVEKAAESTVSDESIFNGNDSKESLEV